MPIEWQWNLLHLKLYIYNISYNNIPTTPRFLYWSKPKIRFYNSFHCLYIVACQQ